VSDSLQDMKRGERGRIVGYNAESKSYRKKFLAMGLTPGVEFSITRFAPLGDPIEIKVRGFCLSLRKAEAVGLLVEKI